jgi:hypothetical protein
MELFPVNNKWTKQQNKFIIGIAILFQRTKHSCSVCCGRCSCLKMLAYSVDLNQQINGSVTSPLAMAETQDTIASADKKRVMTDNK